MAQRLFRHFGKAQPVHDWYRLRDKEKKKKKKRYLWNKLLFCSIALKTKKQHYAINVFSYVSAAIVVYKVIQADRLPKSISVVVEITEMFGLTTVKSELPYELGLPYHASNVVRNILNQSPRRGASCVCLEVCICSISI